MKSIFANMLARTKRTEWKRLLMKELEKQKKDVISLVENLDPYWSGKIVAEAIHGYEKEAMTELTELIGKHIDAIILM